MNFGNSWHGLHREVAVLNRRRKLSKEKAEAAKKKKVSVEELET